jgi:hypothetical protein
MKPIFKAAIIGTSTALLFLLLSWFFGLFGPDILGIIGYIGNLPTSAFIRGVPGTRETRALICLLIQCPCRSFLSLVSD